ncbi:MAG: DUF433 domain-containing protein [bacterium]
MTKLDRITISQHDVHAMIRGKSVRVDAIVSMMAQGKRLDDVMCQYPQLDKEDIFQALGYHAEQSTN